MNMYIQKLVSLHFLCHCFLTNCILLLNHMSKVVYCNNFVAVKLEQLRDICVKVEVAGKMMCS